MNTIQEFNNTYEIVKHILRHDERARNDDKWLIMKVWQEHQQIKIYIPYDKISEMISPETITRCRRRIQNDEKEYLPTCNDVISRRGIRKEDIIEWVNSRNNLIWIRNL